MIDYNSTTMRLAANHIKELLAAEAIFCFGSSKNKTASASLFSNLPKRHSSAVHYDFLVITASHQSVKPGKRIKFKLPEVSRPITCTLIVHTIEEVTQAIKENNRFFHRLVHPMYRVHDAKEQGRTWSTHDVNFDRQADERLTLEYSKTCKEQLTLNARILYDSQKPHICVPIISRQLEHACLFLIYVMMGYEPKNYTLKDLLNLCQRIDPRFEQIIPKITEADRYHYQLLIQGFWKGKYGQDREPIIEYLLKIVDDFTALVEGICLVKLVCYTGFDASLLEN